MPEELKRKEENEAQAPNQEKEKIVTLRQVRREDAQEMVNVWNALVASHALLGRQTPKTLEKQNADLDYILDSVAKRNGHYQVAEVDGHIVGFTGMEYIDRSREKIANIGMIGRLPGEELKGLHIGAKLLQSVLDLAKADGIKTATLQTSQKNTNAIKLYEGFGFKKTKDLPPQEYWGEKILKLEMEKTL